MLAIHRLATSWGFVNVTSKGTGYAIDAGKSGVSGADLLVITGGAVTLNNADTTANLFNGGLNHTGGTLNTSTAYPGKNITINTDIPGNDGYAGNGKSVNGVSKGNFQLPINQNTKSAYD